MSKPKAPSPSPADDHPPAEPETPDFGTMTDRELLEHIAETAQKLFSMLRGVMKRLRALEVLLPEGSEKKPKSS